METWTFSKKFGVTAAFLDSSDSIELVLTVDTVSSVSVNGAVVGQTANSHRYSAA